MDTWEILRDISAPATALIAFLAIRSWRAEYLGKKKIDLMEETLALFYQAKDAIGEMRFWISFPGEGKSREPVEGETEDERKAGERAHVMIERYQRNSETFNRLSALKYRYAAYFGRDSIEAFQQVREVLGELDVANKELAIYESPNSLREFSEQQDREELHQRAMTLRKIIYDSGREDDEIRLRLDDAISKIEQKAKKVIR